MCKAKGKQKDKNKLFLDLIREHPDYPIIPLVDSDVVPDYEEGSFFGSFGFSHIGEFLDYGEKCYQDRDEFLEEWMDAHNDDIELRDMNEQEFENYAINFCDRQKWKDVIYVYIDVFE